jgi:hypothetical protein
MALPLDIVLAGPGIEDQFLSRIHVRTIEDAQIHVASPRGRHPRELMVGANGGVVARPVSTT